MQKNFSIRFALTDYKLAKERIFTNKSITILQGRRRITADTALRLSWFFGNSAQVWLGLHDDYDLEEEKHKIFDELNTIRRLKVS